MAAESFPSRKMRRRKSKTIFRSSLKIIKTNNLSVLIAVIALGIAAMCGNCYHNFKAVPDSAQGLYSYSGKWIDWQDVLCAGIPVLAYFNENEPAAKSELSVRKAVNRVIYFLTNVDTEDTHSLLAQSLPFFAQEVSSANAVRIPGAIKTRPLYPDNNQPQPVKLSGKPLVGIYHTHTSESFISTSDVSHKPGGQSGDIVTVGETLAKELEKRGIRCIQSKTIHDYPSFMKAYGTAEVTVRKMLADNPGIKVVIDLHRDAGKRENYTVNINGGDAARLAMVLAQGQEDLPQPLWQQNLALAKLVDEKINNYYPGLSRGIQFSEWRYNQHLHPHALLIEVGCQENSLEEALRSMEMLADILSDLFKEGKIK